MGFDILVCRFENGEPVPLDMNAAHEVLGPCAAARAPGTGFLLMSTAEGEEAAEVR
ncbi:hypothetical protein ACH5AO_23865 [Streptomyces sp. NPDC018964]|uniref:hypothetical protein n=1 Tax=unclassified Streptomyces TaxID=2593676 RepID=UPI0037A40766